MDARAIGPHDDARELEALERRGLAECWDVLREHGKTFHLMARLLGPVRGDAIAAVYRFARIADDLVDEAPPGEPPERIRARLRELQEELRRAQVGATRDPRFLALGEALRRWAIPLEPFDALVAGLEMDLDGHRYETWADLELYCERVAGAVGLMITPIAGYRGGARALAHARTLGIAMQLTNVLRDVGEDLGRGRIYLPDEDLARFGLTAADLAERVVDGRVRALLQFEIGRARRLYEEGLALVPLLTTARGKAAFQFAVDAYSAILEKIRENGYDVFRRRASLSLGEKLALVPGCTWRAFTAGSAGAALGGAA